MRFRHGGEREATAAVRAAMADAEFTGVMPWLRDATVESPQADETCQSCEGAACEGCADGAYAQCEGGDTTAATARRHDEGDEELDDYETELDWRPPATARAGATSADRSARGGDSAEADTPDRSTPGRSERRRSNRPGDQRNGKQRLAQLGQLQRVREMRESDGERDHSDERLARPSAQSSTTNDDDDDSMGNDEGMGHDEGDVSMRGDEGMEPGIDEAEPTTPGGPREAARSEAARGEAARAASGEAATPEPATEAATHPSQRVILRSGTEPPVVLRKSAKKESCCIHRNVFSKYYLCGHLEGSIKSSLN